MSAQVILLDTFLQGGAKLGAFLAYVYSNSGMLRRSHYLFMQ
jgi:hypothetical protein